MRGGGGNKQTEVCNIRAFTTIENSACHSFSFHLAEYCQALMTHPLSWRNWGIFCAHTVSLKFASAHRGWKQAASRQLEWLKPCSLYERALCLQKGKVQIRKGQLHYIWQKKSFPLCWKRMWRWDGQLLMKFHWQKCSMSLRGEGETYVSVIDATCGPVKHCRVLVLFLASSNGPM